MRIKYINYIFISSILFFILFFTPFSSSHLYGKDNYYKVKSGDTLYSISKKYNISYEKLFSLNPRLSKHILKAGKKIRIHNNTKTHIVKENDTLWSISKQYSISLRTLKKANGLTNRNKIIIGKKLTIPNARDLLFIESLSSYNKVFLPYEKDIIKDYAKIQNTPFKKHLKVKTSNNNIKSTINGMVTFVGKIRGQGNTIIISNKENDFVTIYSSEEMKPLVEANTFVRAKQIIAVNNSPKEEIDFNFYLL